jgi:hypothetical protein
MIPDGETRVLVWTTKSKLEKKYFFGVKFYKWDGRLDATNHDYVKCDDALFDACLATMKPTQDYLLASKSIFRAGCTVPPSCDAQISAGQCTFLDNKVAVGGYIQIEKKFKPIKSRSYDCHGKMIVEYELVSNVKYSPTHHAPFMNQQQTCAT